MTGSFKKHGVTDSYLQSQLDNKRPSARRRCVIIAASSVVLALSIACLSVGIISGYNKHSGKSTTVFSQTSRAIQDACNTTLYPEVCEREILIYPGARTANPRQLAIIGVNIALVHVSESMVLAQNLSTASSNGLDILAVRDCIELLDNAMDELNMSASQLSSLNVDSVQEQLYNVIVWLSASLTYQTTCADGFSNMTGNITNLMMNKQEEVGQVITIALYLAQGLSKLGNSLSQWKRFLPLIHSRRLLFERIPYEGSLSVNYEPLLITPFTSHRSSPRDFPEWLSNVEDRKLLQAPTSTVKYNVLVAKDESGQHSRIQDAVNAIPNNYEGRYVIYIKEGVYNEIVIIPTTLQNVVLLGDGIGKTIITGSRNVASRKYTTYSSATVAVSGRGFIARDITFQNTAGASGQQAVALRVGADLVVFDGCSFEGYQDTLYTLAGRQFYRSCKIYGTVDYVFGDAIAIFQNCDLLARQPLQGQMNTFTAQGRTVDAAVTGFSFLNCSLIADTDLEASTFVVHTYLGRPWKKYARTIFMKSYFDSLVNPAGWLPWNTSNPFITTLYYGEYQNTGPGSGTSDRVNWPGVHPSMRKDQAEQFSVANFFKQTSWLTAADVEFQENL